MGKVQIKWGSENYAKDIVSKVINLCSYIYVF